ncbi:MAG: glycosyltransferase family 2 protein [Desulfobacula sp.]|nr:glycosyltransferase family 2 protein [Desulfobacula sp.]
MKFSVLLPTRNRLDLLACAIETILRQDYSDWEIIVSDNFSDEDIAGYIKSLVEPRIKYFRTQSFIPVTDNWNNALDKCTGDYVIMLGDDDCLMKGYFSTLKRFIRTFESPDFIYTNAFLYAYPDVMPGVQDGFLRTYSRRKIYQSESEPFLLKKNQAMGFVKDALNFKVTFDFNMQFSLVSRRLIMEMKHYGPFYQSPYPDYYATNAMMLKAKRILVVPLPLVTIGISPKSFGFYYFNDAENDGNEFLNNLPDKSIVNRLQKVILPGKVMNTSWLISMETLAVNFVDEFKIDVNYARYRLVQIFDLYSDLIMGKENAKKAYRQLKGKMSFVEWLRFGLLFSAVARIAPRRYRSDLSHRIRKASGSHPGSNMPAIEGQFNTILDVFKLVDPQTQCRIDFKEP